MAPPQILGQRHGGRQGLGERAASRGKDGEGRGPVNGDKVRAFMSFASMCFLIFFFFYRLIQETLTELQNRGKRQLRFEIEG